MREKNKRKKAEKHARKLKKALKREQKAEKYHQDFHYGEEVFSWITPEYIKHEKGVKWYLAWGFIALLVVLYGLFYNAWTLSLVVTALCAGYYIQHFENPKNIKVSISDMGIRIGNKVIPSRNLKAFWIYYQPGKVQTLNFLTTDKIFPEITIQLNGQNPAPIRKYLLRQIPEWEGKEETFTDVLIRLLKI